MLTVALTLSAAMGAPQIPGPPPAPEMVNPCIDSSSPQSKLPWCDPKLPIDKRVKDMVGRIPLKEKLPLLDTGGSPVPSLGLSSYNWWSEASTGVASGRNTQTTKFAFPITTGMSFNRTLWKLTGAQIGREARAMMNAGNGFSTFWAPVINLAREPRWGRNIETPGEDPYLTGEYAEYYSQGMQEAPEDPYHIQASACCKHYVANSMDGTTELDGEHHDRNHVDSIVPMQDLIDSYMLPFQACVEKGRVSGLMCSYNAVNGVPSCANDWLLNEVAREEWGFDGYVTSDCDADNDVVFSHHYTTDPNQGVADVLKAGTDVDCGGFVGKYVASALGNNTITEADIDERLEKLFRVRMRLSHFDPVGPLQGIGADQICNQYSFDLSQDGPAQSSSLLKNEKKTLPLDSSSCGTVAVIGPNANLSQSDSGYYGPHNVCPETPGSSGPPKFWTLVDAVTKAGASKVVTDNAIPNVMSNSTDGIAAAVTMAKSADTVILAVGTDLSWAAEGHDAKSIAFTGAQKQLVKQCADAAKKPIIVVIMTATPLDISEMLTNPKIGAILHTGQPSVTMLGVGDVLFGEKPPAGRMIQTIYPESYQDQISIFDFNMRPGPSAFVRPDCDQKCEKPAMHGGPCGSCPMGTNPGRTHRFYTGKAVIPFGYGLSYTEFSYGINSAPTGTVSLEAVRDMIAQTKSDGRIFPAHALLSAAAPLVNYEINVTNTGSVDSDEVVLGFLKPPGAGENGVPLQTLYGFERVHVPAGKTVTVQLYPSLADFSQVDENGVRHAHPGEYTFHFGVGGEHAATKGMGYAEHKVTAV